MLCETWVWMDEKGSGEMKSEEEIKVEFEPLGPTKSERQWAMGCHLIGLCGLIFPFLRGIALPVPMAGLIGALVFWLVKREDSAFIDDQGKESVNFQISILLYSIFCFLLWFIFVGFFLSFALGVFALVCIIMASIKASEGIAFRYPLCIRLIK